MRLGLGEASEYRLNIDGIPGKEFENVEILAKDSMYIFVETTIDINDFVNTDIYLNHSMFEVVFFLVINISQSVHYIFVQF